MPRCWRLSLTTRAQRTIESRNQSPILQMRNLNNWIKSVLLNLVRRQENAVVCFLERTCLQYIKRGHRVFDLCCGKGGDLQKFTRMGVSLVFGAGFFFFFFFFYFASVPSLPYIKKNRHCRWVHPGGAIALRGRVQAKQSVAEDDGGYLCRGRLLLGRLGQRRTVSAWCAV